MGMQNRGGIPRVRLITIDSSGQYVPFEALSMWLRIKSASGDMRIFTSQADFDAGTNYYELEASEVADMPWEDRGIWLKAGTGSHAVSMIVFHRKG
jgi:hypothetical protein